MKVLLKWIPIVSLIIGGGIGQALASDTPTSSAPAPAKVKYKAGKEVDFESLLIQGQLERPEITVVTGQVDKGADGLLKLRENFLDRVASDQGEEAK
jgi:hypothetical protein